jgi:cyclic pyranopterin monophosphate synthase
MSYQEPAGQGPRMIDVGDKPVSRRTARASGTLRATCETVARIREGRLDKGDPLATARLAGIMAAKRTGDLIPLCHPLPLDAVELAFSFPDESTVGITAVVRATARTGVEMEALLAVAAAGLTIYDMAKSIDPAMSLEQIHLVEKTGGVRGDYLRG